MNLDDALSTIRAALDSDISLMVGYLSKKEMTGKKLTLGQGATQALRDLGKDWVSQLNGNSVVPYEASSELRDGEVFLVDDEEGLAELSPLYAIAEQTAELPQLSQDAVDQRITAYAVVAGGADRIALFKRSDPRLGYSGGRRVIGILKQRLEEIEDPTFAFYTYFDFVLAPTWALVVNQAAFERTFRDAGLVERHIDEWTASAAAHLPWAEGAVEALRRVAIKDSRIWRRLREIHRRGHLSGVGIDDIEAYAKAMDLEVNHLIEDGHLIFDPDDRFSILHLLNEDLFRGALTDVRFEAQRKTGA